MSDTTNIAPQQEHCEVCNFVWEAISIEEIPSRLDRAVNHMIDIVRINEKTIATRPSPERWSILEYASHLRDVLFNIRDRLIVACVEDKPVPPPMYREERVAMGLYKVDSPDDVCAELAVASELFIKFAKTCTPSMLQRELFYGYPTLVYRTIAWGLAQALHECEHHLGDVEENLRLLSH
jgi:hypothetical protein